MTILDFIKKAERIAAAADRAGQRFAAELALVLRRAERRLPPVIEEAATGPSSGIARAARAGRTRRAIENVLVESGYDDVAELVTSAGFNPVLAEAVALHQDAGLALRENAQFLARVEAVKALHYADLLDVRDDVAKALWQAVVRGVFASQSSATILASLGRILDAKEPQIQTLYDTAVSIFGRQVEALLAGDDPSTLFVYLGPDDKKTRPFCHAHVGKVFSRQQIDRMNNGQLDNVFLTGGGYNCRHSFIEIAKSSELASLVNTGERVPEIAARMRAAA